MNNEQNKKGQFVKYCKTRKTGAPLWPAEVDGVPAAGVGGPPLPGTRGRPAQARRGRRRAGRGGRGTAAARHSRAPPIGPAEVARQHAAALRSAPLKREGR